VIPVWDTTPILFDMMPLRVAVVADVLLAQIGGVSRSVGAIVSELACLDPERLQVTVVASRHPLGLDGIPFKRSFAPWVPKLPNSLFALQRPFTLRDFDLVHYMDSRPPLDYPLGRTPKVITQHGFSVLTFGGPLRARRRYVYLNRVLVRLAPYADLTLTASESERQELLRLAPMDPEEVIAIHHGVDHDRFRSPEEPLRARTVVSEQLGVETPYVLYVSNHQRKKNTERLVQAFASVARDEPDVSLVLTGWHTPRFRLVLELIERLGLLSRVKVLGHVPDDLLPSLYGAASVFALPSLHEGFGLPVLEAMACGTPVLTSNVYALPEIAGDGAKLVDPYNVEEIAAGLLHILNDEEYAAALRERGLKRAREFTWQRAAEQHLAAYERALR
jgi:glycosyltransferase involved in cell wall biosynthesis